MAEVRRLKVRAECPYEAGCPWHGPQGAIVSASMPADEGPSYVELATLAMKATPGPWKPDAVYVTAEVQGGRPGGEVIVWAMATASSHRDEARDRRNAAFIAAANPSTILDLIEKLDTEIGKRRYFEAEYRRLTQG